RTGRSSPSLNIHHGQCRDSKTGRLIRRHGQSAFFCIQMTRANFRTPHNTEAQRKTATDWSFQCVAVSCWRQLNYCSKSLIYKNKQTLNSAIVPRFVPRFSSDWIEAPFTRPNLIITLNASFDHLHPIHIV
ncbi:MAG: hypothetical protein KA972_05225, partial [Brachymonas sp.]|nr:hypothetical protein [Brachymonas sp.]